MIPSIHDGDSTPPIYSNPAAGRQASSWPRSGLDNLNLSVSDLILQFPLARHVTGSPQHERVLTARYQGELVGRNPLKGSAYAVLHAGWFQTSGSTMRAPVTVAGRICCLVINHDTVRAPIDTELTAGAKAFIDQHDAVLVFRYGPARTEGGARRLVAVKAHDRYEIHVESVVCCFARPYSLYSAPSGATNKCEPVLFSACDLTGVTANAVIQIDKKNVIQGHSPSSCVSCRAGSGAGRFRLSARRPCCP